MVKRLGRRLLGYVARRWKLATASLLASLAGSAAGLIAPLYARNAVNMLVEGSIEHLWFYAIMIVTLTVVQGLLSFATNFLSQYLAQRVVYDLRNEVYRHLQELSLGFYKRVDTGQLVARATSDVEVSSRFIRFTFSGFASAILTLALALYIMVSLNPLLTAYSLAPLPLMFVLVRIFTKKIRAVFERAREVYGQFTSHLTEVIGGLRVVRALNASNYLLSRFLSMNEEYLALTLRAARLRALTWPSVGMLFSLSLLIVLWIGGSMLVRGEIRVGDLVAMSLYVGMMVWPFIALGFFATMYARTVAALSRVFEILDAEPEVRESENAVPLKVEKGEVRLENVWFSYDGKKWVLKGVSFKAGPNEVVAVVGPTGSGKSTLVQLIPRFYDPQRGRVLIDGTDIREVKLDSLRRQVGIVHQDIYVFPDTIRNNIAYGKPEASMEEVIRAAKLAMLHDFIESLPRGYDTVVGEKGVTLSGGQRQRLAIARTLLMDPKIVILDDSMSNVDAETERAIYEALTKHFKGKTIIVITQRPSTMRLADRIVVLQDGRVVEEGTHDELLRREGIYAKLYDILAPEAGVK